MGFYGMWSYFARHLDPQGYHAQMHDLDLEGKNSVVKPEVTKTVAPIGKKDAIIVVFEGVIASSSWRDKYLREGNFDLYTTMARYDAPNPNYPAMLDGVRDDVKIIIMTNLQTPSKPLIEEWLVEHDIRFDTIHCRYVNSVSEIDSARLGIFKGTIKSNYEVGLVLESVPSCYEMWRAEKVPVRHIDDPNLEPIDVPAPGSVLGEMEPPATEVCGKRKVVGTNPDDECVKAKGHKGVCDYKPVDEQCPNVMNGKRCLRDRSHTEGNCFFSGDQGPTGTDDENECGQRVGSGGTKCNLPKHHGGGCKWNSKIAARKGDLGPWEQAQEPKAVPAAEGEVLAPIAEICGYPSGLLVCVRTKGHSANHTFAEGKTTAEQYAEDYAQYYMGM